jgi:hypothetical protein
LRREVSIAKGRAWEGSYELSNGEEQYQKWLPVIARSLAYLCIQAGELKDKPLGDKAAFLEAAGIERKDVAAMLGTTYGSISETLSKAKRSKKGGGKQSGRKSK